MKVSFLLVLMIVIATLSHLRWVTIPKNNSRVA